MWGYGPQSGMMSGYGGYGYGYGALHMVIWVVILIAIVVGVVWLVRTMVPAGARGHWRRDRPASPCLRKRYARGEINREEYLQKKGDLLG